VHRALLICLLLAGVAAAEVRVHKTKTITVHDVKISPIGDTGECGDCE